MGDSIRVVLNDPETGAVAARVTFKSVTQAGQTTLVTSGTAPPLPAAFVLSGDLLYATITTSALFETPISVCMHYAASIANPEGLRLLQYVESAWIDVTTWNDTTRQFVCARVTSLSQFAIVRSAYTFTGFYPPVDNLPALNVVKAGQAIPIIFSLGGNHGLAILAPGYPASIAEACGVTAEDASVPTETAGGSRLAYAPGSQTYAYIWKTDKRWAHTCRTLILKLSDGSYQRLNFQFE
jgi:hypothetical protein